MKTEEIFKKIYQDLKEEMTSNSSKIFLKEYTIPSINYSKNQDTEDMYFASGIEMELDRIMQQFGYKVYFSSYQDKYFFSNDESKIKEKMQLELEKEDDDIDVLKEKLEEKVNNEYKEFTDNLKKCTPEIILDKAYEKVCKEEMIYKITEKDYEVSDLKALLKADGILQECYDEWLKSDGNINEVLGYAVDTRIDLIIEDFETKSKQNTRESR